MEKKINLEEIWSNKFDCYTSAIVNWKKVDEPAMSRDRFMEVIKEILSQTLELAAKNAEVKTKVVYTMGDDVGEKIYIINKQSILDTINQIE
jgi:hypothetical protein